MTARRGPERPSMSSMALDRGAEMPLHLQLAGQLRARILDGSLPPGTRLPSSRDMAKELGCARAIVLAACELLYAEGCLVSRPRGGVRVASTGRPSGPLIAAPSPRSEAPGPEAGRWSSRWSSLLESRYESDSASPFSTGTPDIEGFPFETWARLLRQSWRRPPRGACIDMPALGWEPLREATSEFLGAVRGLLCAPEEVAITPASSGALDLCCRMLLDPGDEVWVEEPGFIEARWSLKAAGARLVPVPVDEKGLVVAEGIRRAPHAKLAVVTPSNQFPLGVAMSLERRLELLDWAARQGAWIIEDDYNSEFRHRAGMLASLRSLDRQGRVLYLGTFSKVMLPSLRIGYLVADRRVIDAFGRGRARIDVHTAGTVQPALTAFLREGHMLRHLRRLRALYAQRQRAVLLALDAVLAEELELCPISAGLHLTALFTPAMAGRMTDREASERSRRIGNYIQPLSQCYLGSPERQGLVLGYGSLPAGEALPRLSVLARELRL